MCHVSGACQVPRKLSLQWPLHIEKHGRKDLCGISRYQVWTSHLDLEAAVLSSKILEHSERESSWPGGCRVAHTWCSGLEEGLVLPRQLLPPQTGLLCSAQLPGSQRKRHQSPAELVCLLCPSLCLCQRSETLHFPGVSPFLHPPPHSPATHGCPGSTPSQRPYRVQA